MTNELRPVKTKLKKIIAVGSTLVVGTSLLPLTLSSCEDTTRIQGDIAVTKMNLEYTNIQMDKITNQLSTEAQG
jgi:hypothetical protein